MKKTITLFCVLLLCGLWTVQADTRSEQLLARMGALIKGYKQYRVEFSLRADPASAPVRGSYTVSGEKYYLAVAQSEVYCDGRTKYEVNAADKEVLVDRVDPADKSVLANPTRVFDFPDNLFSHAYGGQATFGARKCESVVLRPRQESGVIEQATLLIDPATGLPAGITYKMADVSDPVTVEVLSIKPLDSAPAAMFAFDRAKYKGFEVIDFR